MKAIIPVHQYPADGGQEAPSTPAAPSLQAPSTQILDQHSVLSAHTQALLAAAPAPANQPAPLAAVELPEIPPPGPGEVLIKVHSAGINRADLLQAAGHYPPPPGAGPVLGLEAAGTVAALGAGVTDFQLKQGVCALLSGGGYGEYVTAPAAQCWPVPTGWSFAQAAGTVEALTTAWSNLYFTAHLQPGETALIHGGSGGIGSIAVQLAAHFGAKVLTTAGSPERATQCISLGADYAFDYHHSDLAHQIMDATSGRGVDVILDVTGAGGLDLNTSVLAVDGRMTIIGLQRGRTGQIDLSRLTSKRAMIAGTALRSRSPEYKARLCAEIWENTATAFASGAIKPQIYAQLPMLDAYGAHQLLNTNTVFGNLVLNW